MSLHPEIVLVEDADHTDEVLGVMERFTAQGHGWINLQPELADDAEPSSRSTLTQFFRRNSPEVALGTWVAPAVDPADAPQQIGVQHALGTRLAPLLEEWDLPLGADWRRGQDSPRRGLLVTAPADTPHDEVLRWLLHVTLVATRRKTSGRWSVTLYEGRG